jgi:hypothetical protein
MSAREIGVWADSRVLDYQVLNVWVRREEGELGEEV